MQVNETVIQTENDNKQNGAVVVEMEHLRKSFGNNHVLRDINLVIRKGETLAILGHNISGLKYSEMIEIQKKIGFLFQSGALYDSMSVRENLEFPLRRQIRSIPKEKIESLVKEALQDVGLVEAIDKAPSELSGGMRKRLGLARTLILKPEIMLYDEPTTGLDPITSKEISKLILEVQRKYDTTSIIITHDIECVKLTADRIIVLKNGICAAEGTYNELEKSADPWVRSFFQ